LATATLFCVQADFFAFDRKGSKAPLDALEQSDHSSGQALAILLE